MFERSWAYTPSEEFTGSGAPSDGNTIPWEAGYRKDQIEHKSVIEISELWLWELAKVMIADKKTETAEILTASADDSNGVATWVMGVEQQKEMNEVSYNLWSEKNTEIRNLMQQNGEVMQVPVHKHFRNSKEGITNMAYDYSDQDKTTWLEQAETWMSNQVLVYDNKDTGDVYFRGYRADIATQSISNIDISVWWLRGEIICKKADGTLVAYSWEDVATAIFAAENGITFEEAKWSTDFQQAA